MSTQTVVITGSSRGLGLGMAQAFLARGHRVVISSRSATAVDAALKDLSAAAPQRVAGRVCDVGRVAEVQSLWDFAIQQFSRVDIWVNNAGLINSRRNLADLAPEDIDRVVQANVLGVMHGSRIALRGMLSQDAGPSGSGSRGQILNFEGFGSDGMKRPGLSVYGATKSAVRYFTRSLCKEYGDSGVLIGTINPGIVVTELLLDESQRTSPEDWTRAKKRLRLLADRVEDVAPALVAAVLANQAQGARIQWLTPGKLLRRLALAPFRSRDPFAGTSA